MKDTVHPVDEVINKMKEVEGFGGFVICNNDGVVLRHENLGAADKLGIHLCGNQPVRSSRRRVDGVEDAAMVQHERAVKF